jgi:hypothetical protein
MPSGAAVIRRPDKHSTAWAIKWCDIDGRQCWETLGREPAWNEAKAQRELGKRLQAVKRDRWRKPERVTFSAFADRSRPTICLAATLSPQRSSTTGSPCACTCARASAISSSPQSSPPTSTRTSPPRRASSPPRRLATISASCA